MTEKEIYQLQEDLKQIFKNHPEAYTFCLAYITMCHNVDDIIDEKKCDSEFVLHTTYLLSACLNNPFYRKHQNALQLVDVLVNSEYATSTKWEKEEGWKRFHADSMRHAGCLMLDAVLYIIAGRDVMRNISPRFREFSQCKHMNDLINYSDNGKKSNTGNRNGVSEDFRENIGSHFPDSRVAGLHAGGTPSND